MRKTLLVIFAVLTLACGTGSSLVRPELTETAKAVCDLYENAKPKVVALRSWAKLNWNATVPGTNTPVIPSEVKETLTEFDKYLPEIDAAGKLICSFADASSVAAANDGSSAREKLKNVPWDKVLAVTVKAVDLAVRYQQGKG